MLIIKFWSEGFEPATFDFSSPSTEPLDYENFGRILAETEQVVM